MKHNNAVGICIKPPHNYSLCSDNVFPIKHTLYIKILIFILFLGCCSCGMGTYFELYTTFMYRPHASLQLIYLMGLVIGASFSALLMPFVGRRTPLVYSIIPTYPVLVINALLQGNHVADMITRLLAGFSIGAYLTTALVFLGELSFQSFRAMNYAVLLLGHWIGLWIYVLLYKLDPLYSLIMLIFPTLFIILGLIYLPESPYYVMQINHPEFAAEVLYFLRCGSLCRQEAEFMGVARYVFRYDRSYWGFLRRRVVLDRFATVFLLCTFCNFSGFFIFIISLRILGEDFDYIAHGLIGALSLIGYVIYTFLVDKVKRFLLILVSFLGTFCAIVTLNLYFGVVQSEIILYVTTPLFFAFYFMGQASMPFLFIGEIFSHQLKPAACGISVSAYFILMALANFLTREIWLGCGPLACCIFFTMQNIFGLVFARFLIPEYLDYSLEDVQNYFDGSHSSSICVNRCK